MQMQKRHYAVVLFGVLLLGLAILVPGRVTPAFAAHGAPPQSPPAPCTVSHGSGKCGSHGQEHKHGKVTWSQSRVVVTLEQGSTKTVTVTFTSTVDLKDVSLQLRPASDASRSSTKPEIQINGATTALVTIGAVTADTPVTVTLTVTAPAHSNGGLSGVIQVISAGHVVPASLHIHIKVKRTATS